MENAYNGEGKQKFDWYSLIAALILIIIGVTILIAPDETSTVLVYVVGALITAAGIVRTVLYFSRNERTSPFSFGGLTVGLTLLAVGILLLLRPDILKSILSIVLGCLLIFSGFGNLQTAVELARLKVAKWWLPLIFALLAIVCGVIAVTGLISVTSALMIFLGVALCVEGILLIISLCLFRKKV